MTTSSMTVIGGGGPLAAFGTDWERRKDRWVFGRFVPAGPEALNLHSRGLVPTGKPVETPAVLLDRPLRPPGRR